MRLSPTLRLQLTCVAMSLIVTGAVVIIDHHLTTQVETRRGEAHARQVVAQLQRLESVALFEAVPLDRLERAVGWLNTTGAARMVRIELLTQRSPEWAASEGSRYRGWDVGELEYWRWLKPERPLGVKVTVALGYRGFLGARNSLSHDFGIFIVALALFLFFYLFTGQLWGWKLYRGQANFSASWQGEGRSLAYRLTTNLREVVKQARTIAVSANRSRTRLVELQGHLENLLAETESDSVRAQLTELHQRAVAAQKPYQDLFATSRQLNEWITQTLVSLQGMSAHVEKFGRDETSDDSEDEPALKWTGSD